MIPYGRQSITDDDIEAVVKVLQSDHLTQGPAVEEFEQQLAATVDARYAVAFSNGTAALHGACHAAELGVGDRVATTPLTFVASANCARYVGAEVELVDIDESTGNIDLSLVPRGLDGLVVVHYAGLPVDLASLTHRPPVVIEDAAHAIGAHTPAGPVGNCAHSDMTTFSFHPVKTITTGEGGAVTTNSAGLAERLRRFRTHGVLHLPEHGGWYYEVEELGFNYRLTDIQAALGSSQLHRLAHLVSRREELARRYDRELAALPVRTPAGAPPGFVHGRHLYPVRVPDRDHVYSGLRAEGIGVQVHYVPLHRHPRFASVRGACPVADSAYAELLSLPLYPDLTEAGQDRVIDALSTALTRVQRGEGDRSEGI